MELRLPSEIWRMVERIKRTTNAETRTEVIRRSIQCYDDHLHGTDEEDA
jgi:hypothetical protein